MKSLQFLILLLFLSLSYINQAQARTTNFTRTQVAGGAYHKSGKSLPLLLVSNNNGESWTFISNISNLPCDSYAGMISVASCNDAICSAVGSGFTQIPLLVSHDQGQTWALVQNIPGFPSNLMPTLSSISCSTNACIAAGTYFNTTTATNMPLIVKGDSRGQSWTFVQNISELPTDLVHAELNSVSCSGTLCSAIGSYENISGLYQLLLLVSDNSGESWKAIKNSEPLPNDFNMADLLVNCIGDTCVVAGNYNTTTKLPLLLISNDKGNQWTMIKTISGRPIDMNDGQFSTVSCTGKICVAAGVYHENDISLPLLIQSKNNGKTWSIVHNLLNLPDNMTAAEISSVACSGNICVAGGHYSMGDPKLSLPFLLVSSNSGDSWKFVDKITGIPSLSAGFDAVSCAENTCIAAGEYYHVGNDIDLPPPLVVSNDQGQTWTFVENIPGFPKKLKSAKVFALTSATEAKTNHFLTHK